MILGFLGRLLRGKMTIISTAVAVTATVTGDDTLRQIAEVLATNPDVGAALVGVAGVAFGLGRKAGAEVPGPLATRPAPPTR